MSVGSLPTAAHRPGGTPPSEGGVPPPRWAEPNYPSVINKPAATRPDASDNSMTEATSMTRTASAIISMFPRVMIPILLFSCEYDPRTSCSLEEIRKAAQLSLTVAAQPPRSRNPPRLYTLWTAAARRRAQFKPGRLTLEPDFPRLKANCQTSFGTLVSTFDKQS